MTKFNHYSFFIVFISLFLILSSCGYHLRGNISLPENLQNIYIQDEGNHEISRLLKQRLLENKVTVVDSAASAQSIIAVYASNTERRAIAVRGKEVKEYEIRLMTTFTVHEPDGTQRGETQTISTSRRYSFNNDQVLGASNEEQILIKEMHEDVVVQILRRIPKL